MLAARSVFYLFILMVFGSGGVFASTPRACLGGVSLGSFRLLVEPQKSGSALPIHEVNRLQPGEKLKYEPLHLRSEIKDKARIALLIVPTTEEASKKLIVLEEKKASAPAEWDVPVRASVVGLVFGPHGLDVKKVDSLVAKNEDLISELADYAQQTATVEALVQTLSDYEQSAPGERNLSAVLQGFSTQYGVGLPKLDASAPADQQASLLLRAVLPSVSTYDPLNSNRSTMVQQSAGLAASVAGLFFGTPVTLAAGGASLFLNFRTMMFPDTNLRSAFAQPAALNGLELCSKAKDGKSRTRVAYLWAVRVPDAAPPSLSLATDAHFPLGRKSNLKVNCATVAQLKLVPRARAWELVSANQRAPVPVTVAVGVLDDTLTLDLTQAKLPAGEYRLAAYWDWDPLEVKGTVTLHPIADLSPVKLTPESEDRLVSGNGSVSIELTGADFEFVQKAVIKRAGGGKPDASEISITLPKGAGGGEQRTMTASIDTSSLYPGEYLLALTQTNGSTYDLPITVHSPNSRILNLPLRANLGEPQQSLSLHGSGLERIFRLSSDAVTWELAPIPPGSHDLTDRSVVVKLGSAAKTGDVLAIRMQVNGIHEPIQIPAALQLAGPRPKILNARTSFAQQADIALREGEIPAGSAASFALQAQNSGDRPKIEVACHQPGATKRALVLHPGGRDGGSQLDIIGEGLLYLLMDPGVVGHSGCELTVTISDEPSGISDPYTLGRIIRLPQIDKFLLTDQRLGSSLYVGILTGRDLQVIEKTGWNAQDGSPVQGAPTPSAGNPQGQTLKIALPWPPPSPRAPLFIWLRGESQGRKSDTRY